MAEDRPNLADGIPRVQDVRDKQDGEGAVAAHVPRAGHRLHTDQIRRGGVRGARVPRRSLPSMSEGPSLLKFNVKPSLSRQHYIHTAIGDRTRFDV